MATLHIEHPITDLATWLEAFNGFDHARQNAGVTAQRIFTPADDQQYVVVHLDFDTLEQATDFREFLEQVVWQSSDLSPALDGTPTARVLNEVQPT